MKLTGLQPQNFTCLYLHDWSIQHRGSPPYLQFTDASPSKVLSLLLGTPPDPPPHPEALRQCWEAQFCPCFHFPVDLKGEVLLLEKYKPLFCKLNYIYSSFI